MHGVGLHPWRQPSAASSASSSSSSSASWETIVRCHCQVRGDGSCWIPAALLGQDTNGGGPTPEDTVQYLLYLIVLRTFRRLDTNHTRHPRIVTREVPDGTRLLCLSPHPTSHLVVSEDPVRRLGRVRPVTLAPLAPSSLSPLQDDLGGRLQCADGEVPLSPRCDTARASAFHRHCAALARLAVHAAFLHSTGASSRQAVPWTTTHVPRRADLVLAAFAAAVPTVSTYTRGNLAQHRPGGTEAARSDRSGPSQQCLDPHADCPLDDMYVPADGPPLNSPPSPLKPRRRPASQRPILLARTVLYLVDVASRADVTCAPPHITTISASTKVPQQLIETADANWLRIPRRGERVLSVIRLRRKKGARRTEGVCTRGSCRSRLTASRRMQTNGRARRGSSETAVYQG
nr:hypothetical protein CFP56_09080 [Quercus suber]